MLSLIVKSSVIMANGNWPKEVASNSNRETMLPNR